MKEENKLYSGSILAKIFCVIFVLVMIIIVMARYATDQNFRSEVDAKVLKKEVYESTLNTIEIDSDTNPSIFAYDKYITVLSENKLKEYTSDGKAVAELDVNISVPLVATNEKYMAIAEKNGQKAYLISGSSIIWQNTLEGSISRINVNKNGYVSIIIKNTIYKSVIIMFDSDGKEMFRSYQFTDYAICTSISTDNKYLAVGEINYSGTVIKSYVKIISAELAQTDPDNSTVYSYESDNGEILTAINYQDKENVVCMFTNYIEKIGPDSNSRLYDITDKDLFVDVSLNNGIAIIDKQSSGLFSFEYELNVKAINTNNENLYVLENDLPKNMYVSGDVIALASGNEVQIVSANGWLLKNYSSEKQINSIVVGDSIVGIVYKNRIELIQL